MKSPEAAKFAASIGPMLDKMGDNEIVFSANIIKLNSKGKQDPRVLVCYAIAQ